MALAMLSYSAGTLNNYNLIKKYCPLKINALFSMMTQTFILISINNNRLTLIKKTMDFEINSKFYL